MKLLTSSLLLLSWNIALHGNDAAVVINEVADKGSSGVCNGDDWVELHNTGSDPIDMAGWILYDDNGPNDSRVHTFAGDDASIIGADEYLLLCTPFKIGGDDTITLLDAGLTTVSTVGPLLGGDNNGFDITYALDESGSESYSYTTTPTPGSSNVIAAAVAETAEDIKQRLALQNEMGEKFFNFDSRGDPVSGGMPAVLEFHLNMTQANRAYLYQNRSYETYVPFESIQIKDKQGQVVEALQSPGRIRSKGQSSLYTATCLGAPSNPFQLDMDSTNATQTLFGVQRLYLRTHENDPSYIREYTMHRMLARFGLPHMRTRHVNVFINDEKVGFYTLMEAPDQDYVFARNFPDYDPFDYALYKVKSMSMPHFGCPTFTEAELEKARAKQAADPESVKGPYMYERGEHREQFPVFGNYEECGLSFVFNYLMGSKEDSVEAYVNDGEPGCSSFFLDEGFVDRDLGKNGKRYDPLVENFINDTWFCGEECTDTEKMTSHVDTESFLKNIAVYAATITTDSPLGNGNNWYMAGTGNDETGWKIVQYDHNAAGDIICRGGCDEKLIYWSIIRPTCKSLESNHLVGPLLTDPELHKQYLEYVQSFVDMTMGNKTFVQELQWRLYSIQDDIQDDYWMKNGTLELELSNDPADWEHESVPWIPFLKARSEEIRLQMKALEDGTFARGPHLEESVEPDEVCADWRSGEEAASPCPGGCDYEGCFQEGWTVPAACNAMSGSCYHADADPLCEGTPFFTQYEGMENRGDMPTICFVVDGVPVSMSDCPPRPEENPDVVVEKTPAVVRTGGPFVRTRKL